jgi:D-amino-acid dehydrogenase
MDDVIVIGGGIVGASAAYRLACGGVRVTLIERADPGQATAAGAGIISPGTTFKSPAAFYPLAFQAVAYYEDLLRQLAEDGETQTGYETVGLLHIATSEEEAARLSDLLRLIEERRAAGVKNIGDIKQIDKREARALFPALGAIYGAIYTSGAARVDGRLLRDALRRAAQRHGARILTDNAELAVIDDQTVQVKTNSQVLSAPAVIIAGGAWSGAFAEALGLRLPVYPQRGQILHLELPGVETGHWPIIVGFHSHYLLTFPTHRVVAGATREESAGFDPRLTAGGVYEVLGEALRVAPGLAGATLREMRVGLRPASPDGLPLLGRVPGFAQVFLATGHGPSGLQLGPYSGALVADLLRGLSPSIDLAPFAPERFQKT